ncbi:flagellar basal body P-ring formation protein FlgA [Roseospira marina]|uniref:Flagellar basal body P-ring formation protein FlgA n=1 Tax=Roseospira marina TaxID=140057 RepID=A0A5M6IFP9_9PROT|nr:flagellar basal body P-ring formation chaperone FlgA [Roseospira marina]KAA5606757.1 flagellar basal body P-ring formation protein FlgA [Roseospira marina]MBB4313821.1 flagella basal body P-ring formation protein FlgA [Roseospira marina]MBB5086983.1 flagella basal body P-ring formation protein FlgA [Roseospira marina]
MIDRRFRRRCSPSPARLGWGRLSRGCGAAHGRIRTGRGFAFGAAFGLAAGLALLLTAPLGGSGVAHANEVVMPVAAAGAVSADPGGTPAGAEAAAPLPDITALADALVNAATRRSVLDGTSSDGRGVGGMVRAVLRPEVTIERPLLQLGDVFGGLPKEVASVPVGHAPDPGGRLVLDAAYLEALATDYGVDWRPASRFVQAIVSRTGYPIGRVHAVEALRARLLDEGMPPEAEVDVNMFTIQAVVGTPEEARVAVRDLYYDNRTGRFNALLQVPAEGPNARPVRLTGSVHVSVDVPVLIRPIRRDMVITEADLGWDSVRRSDLRPDILLDPEDLLGRAARYGIQAGRPVRVNQVRLPELIHRNGLVTMVLETPFMTVTARGRALESGARGETVRIANLASDKEVLAVVTGRDTVQVRMDLVTVATR